MQDFDTAVKIHIYRIFADRGTTPDAAKIAVLMDSSIDEVEQSFERLFEERVLVLNPGSHDIRMAPPFSAVESPFLVKSAGKSYYANCVWDGLGVLAALHLDGDVFTACADSGAAMAMQVRNDAVLPLNCAVHFAVPAAHW